MKQVLFKKGRILTAEVPEPQGWPGMALVNLRTSCISPGTELSGVANSGKTLLRKAWEQPEKAMAAWTRMRRYGVAAVLRQAQSKQSMPQATGYSAAGIVTGIGAGLEGLRVGDRVAVAGASFACHAEQVAVPGNLIVPMPETVGFDQAATVALGAIALQGVRRANAQLGEWVAVLGCGAIGLLCVQLLRAAGCRVLALDLNADRLRLAEEFGAELVVNTQEGDAVKRVTHYCNGHGADAVIVAVATESSEPLLQAFQMARRKGRVVLLGVTGKEFSRDAMYAKELDFVVSTSYGPGRYDDSYEKLGIDYPYGYVRWTERRNMAAYLDLIARRQATPEKMIGARFDVDHAADAYAALQAEPRPLLALIEYADKSDQPAQGSPSEAPATARWVVPRNGKTGIALLGIGDFTRGMHIPLLLSLPDCFDVKWAVDHAGMRAQEAADRFPQCRATTDVEAALRSADVDAVLIGTRHSSHADLAIRALRAGKAVFCEKPMCLTAQEFENLRVALNETDAPYMVGYNRRFSPCALEVRRAVEERVNPLMIQYTMNAGYIPYSHWTQTDEGGGRMMGEACHIFDLFRYVIGYPAATIAVEALTPRTESVHDTDNRSVTIRYTDGSVAVLLYTALGHPQYAKENMTVFFDEKTLFMRDYCELQGYGCRVDGASRKHVDKGHLAEWKAFHAALHKGPRFPIDWGELEETWRISLLASGSASEHIP